jgi:hypothetical protein
MLNDFLCIDHAILGVLNPIQLVLYGDFPSLLVVLDICGGRKAWIQQADPWHLLLRPFEESVDHDCIDVSFVIRLSLGDANHG